MTIAIQGFANSVKSIARNAGLDNMRVATYPGVISTHETPTIVRNVEEQVVDQIVDQLTKQQPKRIVRAPCPGDRDIVFRGSFEEVNRHFLENDWSDGLPIVPPTKERIAAFLRYTDRKPDEVLDILLPEKRAVHRANILSLRNTQAQRAITPRKHTAITLLKGGPHGRDPFSQFIRR